MIGDLVEHIVALIGARSIVRICIYLSGLDLPAEINAFSAALAAKRWSRPAGSRAPVTENDLFALLRAGTSAPNAIAAVCGTGINALGVRADGRTARFPALGTISGDWGGGSFLGERALWLAARSEDGRGPQTILEQLVPAAIGLGSVAAVTEAVHFNRIPESAISSLCPVLFQAARDGDTVAAATVDRQAEEIVLLIVSAIRRLNLLAEDIPVILGGGVLASNDTRLITGITAGLAAVAPRAGIHLLTTPPILGAGLLALESVDTPAEAVTRARAYLLDPARSAVAN